MSAEDDPLASPPPPAPTESNALTNQSQPSPTPTQPLVQPSESNAATHHTQASPTPTQSTRRTPKRSSRNSNSNAINLMTTGAIYTEDSNTGKQVLLLHGTKPSVWQVGGRSRDARPGHPSSETFHQIHRHDETHVISGLQLNMQLIRNDAEITDVILQRWKVLFTFYNRIRATLLTGNLLEGADYRVHVKQLFNIRNIDSIHIQDALRRCSDMRNNLLNNQTRGPTTKATFFIANSISVY